VEALLNLKSVLCDPEGCVCISGSNEDTHIIQSSLTAIEKTIEKQAAQIAELQEQLDLQIPASVMAQQMRKIAEQAAQIEMMRDALSKIEYLESANGCIMSAGDCSSVATEALSTTPDQALEQFTGRVREQCAEVCEEHQGSAETCAAAIRAIKELP